jgi:hypothetical protein
MDWLFRLETAYAWEFQMLYSLIFGFGLIGGAGWVLLWNVLKKPVKEPMSLSSYIKLFLAFSLKLICNRNNNTNPINNIKQNKYGHCKRFQISKLRHTRQIPSGYKVSGWWQNNTYDYSCPKVQNKCFHIIILKRCCSRRWG